MLENTQLLVEIGPGLSLAVGLPTIGTWKTINRPKNAKKGTFGYNSQSGCLEYWDGESWYTARMA